MLVRAAVGDRILIAAALGRPVRDGEILEVGGLCGTPPFLVQWSDEVFRRCSFAGPTPTRAFRSRITTLLVGSDGPRPSVTEAQPTAGQATGRHAQRWQVDINLYEDGDHDTTAEAVLHTPAPRALKSRGKPTRIQTTSMPRDRR